MVKNGSKPAPFRVTSGHFRVTSGHFRVTSGHFRVTSESLLGTSESLPIHFRVTSESLLSLADSSPHLPGPVSWAGQEGLAAGPVCQSIDDGRHLQMVGTKYLQLPLVRYIQSILPGTAHPHGRT